MNSLIIVLLFSLFFAAPAGAAIYRWIGTDGVVHYVDDLHKVPQEERHQLGLDLDELEEEMERVRKGKVKPAEPEPERPPTTLEAKKPIDPGAELFGGKTLEWWIRTFSRVRRERSELTKAISAKEEYLHVFEGGRGFGKIFTQKSIDRYDRYREALPEEKERLVKKETVLEDLIRRAKNAGVPRAVREE